MWVLLVLIPATGSAAQDPTAGPGTVVDVRVHGNHTTPNADVLGLAGEVVGKPASDALVAEVAARLRQSGRFEAVEVRKRYRSIANPDDILLVIIVTERPGISDTDLTPGAWKRLTSRGMFLPIVSYEDGYGFAYGARVSIVDLLGPGSRVSIPLTWGGERQAQVQVERAFSSGPIGRLAGDAGIARRENPHDEIGDTRAGMHVRAERAVRRWLRVGGGGGFEDVTFGALRDRLGRTGADLSIDTRVDPAFPRNAVHATVGWEHLTFDTGRANRTTTDLGGYVGIGGQTVLAVRGLAIVSSDPLPPYEQSLLGGAATLRGYRAGYRAGDNLAALSAELRVPLSSPLAVGRLGVKAFVDAGTTYASGARLRDQHLDTGVGGGVYLQLTVLSLSLDVARSEAGSIRAHFGLGVTFK